MWICLKSWPPALMFSSTTSTAPVRGLNSSGEAGRSAADDYYLRLSTLTRSSCPDRLPYLSWPHRPTASPADAVRDGPFATHPGSPLGQHGPIRLAEGGILARLPRRRLANRISCRRLWLACPAGLPGDSPLRPTPYWVSTLIPASTGVMQVRTFIRPLTFITQSVHCPIPQKMPRGSLLLTV